MWGLIRNLKNSAADATWKKKSHCKNARVATAKPDNSEKGEGGGAQTSQMQ